MATSKKTEVVAEEVKEVKEVKKAPAKKAPAKKATTKTTETKATKATKAAKVEKTEEVKEVKEVKAEKKAAKAKKEVKVEAPAKPLPTEARAIARNVRVTPRKVRLVIDVIRGKDVKEALGLLKNINKSAVADVTKVVKSAAANAVNNFSMDENRLYIAEIYAHDGLRMRRYLPRAKGSASGLVKRAANITVVVKMR